MCMHTNFQTRANNATQCLGHTELPGSSRHRKGQNSSDPWVIVRHTVRARMEFYGGFQAVLTPYTRKQPVSDDDFSFSANNHSEVGRLSYDGRAMSCYFHTSIYVPAIVPNALQAHICQCDHKTNIVIS